MSLDQGMRFGTNDYHRGFGGENLGFGSIQTGYQNENFQNNLNQLLNEQQNPPKFCSDSLGSQISSHLTLQSLLKDTYSNFDSPDPTFSNFSSLHHNNFSSFHQTRQTSHYSSFQPSLSELHHQNTFPTNHQNSFTSRQQTPSFVAPQGDSSSFSSPFQSSTSLFSNDLLGLSSLAHFSEPAPESSQFRFARAPGTSPQQTSVLGLSDISSRLEATLSLSSQPPSSLPSETSGSSRSRNSTPLSWNPLGPLSGTPLSSVTPSPILTLKTSVPSTVQEGEFVFFSDEEQDRETSAQPRMHKTPKKKIQASKPVQNRPKVLHVATSNPSHQTAIRGIQALASDSQQSQSVSSWAGVVRTSSSRLPQGQSSPSPPPVKEQTFATASQTNGASHSGPAVSNTINPATLDFHRGPKVDPRWPVSQQVFLGPIPMSISWDEIRNVFYTKVSRRELLHFYVQSKPVNEVVYGQVVFDKPALANKILKEGPVKVRGVSINVTSMKEKVRAEKKK